MYLTTIRILIWVSAICYMLQSIYYPGFDIAYGLSYIGNENFSLIQFISYSFLHGDPFHLLVNMFMLVLFGSKIEMMFGRNQFLILYFLSVIGGALLQTISNMVIIYNHFGTPFPIDSTTTIVGQTLFALENGQYIKSVFSSLTIGASGGIFGCMVAFTILFPTERFNLILIPLSISARWLVVTYLIIELYNGMIADTVNIAHFAHLGGALFGFIYALILKSKYNI